MFRSRHVHYRRLIMSISLVLLSTTLTFFAGPVTAQGRPELGRPGQQPVEIVAGQVLVKFRPGATGKAIAEAHRQNGGQEFEQIARTNIRIVKVPPGQERSRAAAYSANPNVEFAEVNGFYYALARPKPPAAPTEADLIARQWQYNNTGQTGGTADKDIDGFEAWTITKGSGSVRVAVLDTGIDLSHPDLGDNVVGGVNFTNSSTLDDKYGHGTHVAGTVAAVNGNGIGVSGTCPSCGVYNVKVLGDNGSGSWSGIANGIIWAASPTNGLPPAKVINLSLGSYSPSKTVEDAVMYAWDQGVVVVAAAGNDGQNWGLYPAAYNNVIAVAATDHHDAKASFSNYGGNWVSLAAPGAGIFSTATDHRSTLFRGGPSYDTLSGTSMATPHVAGVAGLVSTVCRSATMTKVRELLEGSADRIAGTGSGGLWQHGRLNAHSAVTRGCS